MPAISFPPMRLTFADGHVEEVKIWPADLYRLEQQTGKSISNIGQDMGFRQLLDLAFLAAKRSRIVNGDSIDEFLDQIAEVDILAEAPKAPSGPDPGPSIGS